MKHGRPDYDARVQDTANIIPADEPVFLLRGADRFAARVVRFYADQIEAADAPADHVAAVRSHALAMQNWRPKKMPDAPSSKPSFEEQGTGYDSGASGHELQGRKARP